VRGGRVLRQRAGPCSGGRRARGPRLGRSGDDRPSTALRRRSPRRAARLRPARRAGGGPLRPSGGPRRGPLAPLRSV